MSKRFEETVRAMTGKEIVMAMVNGIQKQHVKLDMSTFGTSVLEKGKVICVGCAATNTICEISGITFKEDNIKTVSTRANSINSGESFLRVFGYTMDALRRGDIEDYNYNAQLLRIAELPMPKHRLPYLSNSYQRSDLHAYVDYANSM